MTYHGDPVSGLGGVYVTTRKKHRANGATEAIDG
jgi:hypothetical protein